MSINFSLANHYRNNFRQEKSLGFFARIFQSDLFYSDFFIFAPRTSFDKPIVARGKKIARTLSPRNAKTFQMKCPKM